MKAPSDPPAAAARYTLEPPASPLRGRVLVVDDDDAVRRTLARVLKSEHDVVAVGDPRDAAHMLGGADDAFDVVLCDLTMPHVSGMNLFRMVERQNPALAERFVFVTGGDTHPEVRRFLANVANPCVLKPFNNLHLKRTARECMLRAKRYVL